MKYSIKTGKLDLEAAPINRHQLLEEFTYSSRWRLLEKHTEFIVHIPLDISNQVRDI